MRFYKENINKMYKTPKQLNLIVKFNLMKSSFVSYVNNKATVRRAYPTLGGSAPHNPRHSFDQIHQEK